jgi:hypothetical protein
MSSLVSTIQHGRSFSDVQMYPIAENEAWFLWDVPALTSLPTADCQRVKLSTEMLQHFFRLIKNFSLSGRVSRSGRTWDTHIAFQHNSCEYWIAYQYRGCFEIAKPERFKTGSLLLPYVSIQVYQDSSEIDMDVVGDIPNDEVFLAEACSDAGIITHYS